MLPSPCLTVNDDELFIEGVAVAALAEQFGTPTFVMSERQLRDNVQNWRTAMVDAWPEGAINILPSFKANTCLAIRHLLSQEGAGCDTFGLHELRAALSCGVNPALLSANGTAKNRALVELAVHADARITLDHPDELPLIQQVAAEQGKVASIRFRVRLHNDELDDPSDLMPSMPSHELLRMYKPGIPFDALLPLGKAALAMSNVSLTGLHIHIARNASHLAYWEKAMSGLAKLVAQLHAAWDGWLPRELDLGGGYSYPFDPAGRANPALTQKYPAASLPTPQQYAQTLTRSIRQAFKHHNMPTEGMTLEVEPGRAMLGNAGIHLTRVRNLKREVEPVPWVWVETDTSEIFLSGIGLEHSDFPVLVDGKVNRPVATTADIVGISCNFDLLAPQVELPNVQPADLIIFANCGAYEEANSSNFNLLGRPATVLVNSSEATVIRRRESYDDVIARDLVPDRLR